MQDFFGKSPLTVGITTDHGGLELKNKLAAYLQGKGLKVHDFGPATLDPEDDYPDYAAKLSWAVVRGDPNGQLRQVVIAASGVLAQFGGVMLAFAFLATFGFNGLVTIFFKSYLKVDVLSDASYHSWRNPSSDGRKTMSISGIWKYV